VAEPTYFHAICQASIICLKITQQTYILNFLSKHPQFKDKPCFRSVMSLVSHLKLTYSLIYKEKNMKNLILSVAIAGTLLGTSSPVFAYEQGDWVVRVGMTNVAPDDSSNNVNVAGADLGVGVNVGSNTQLGLNFVYFYSPQLAIEVLAATPFSHDIGLDTLGPLGSTKHLPPTISVNYYFAPPSARFQPYVGAGINYTIFFDEEFSRDNSNAGFSKLDLDNSFGLAAQVGFDYMLDEKWLVNASVHWLNIDTEANFDLNDSAGSVDVSIDPFVYSITAGYRF
jgi:outer membrane protein